MAPPVVRRLGLSKNSGLAIDGIMATNMFARGQTSSAECVRQCHQYHQAFNLAGRNRSTERVHASSWAWRCRGFGKKALGCGVLQETHQASMVNLEKADKVQGGAESLEAPLSHMRPLDTADSNRLQMRGRKRPWHSGNRR